MPTVFLSSFEDSNPSKKQAIERWLLDNVDESQQRNNQVICFLNSTAFYLTSLPDTRKWRSEFKAGVLSSIVDRDMKEDMVKSGLINWCHNVRSLAPVQVPRDGNCLLHSVGVAVWGITDRSLMLRRLLCLALEMDQGHRFQGRWLHQRQRQISQFVDKLLESSGELMDKEWTEIRQCLEPECSQSEAVPYRFLEPIHVYTLSNILRRPIIILTDSTARTLRGLSLQDNDMGGIYLPLEWNWADTCRTPILLSYSQSHFCPLIFTDYPNQLPKETKTKRDLAPLVNSQFEQFPVRFLLPGEEPQVAHLLRKYLRVRETVMKVKETVQNILCAELEVRSLPAELDLVTDFIQDCLQRFQQGAGMVSPHHLPLTPAVIPQASRMVNQECQQVPAVSPSQELTQNVRREQLQGTPTPQFAFGDPTLHSMGGLGHQINIPPPSITPVRNPTEESISLNPSPEVKCVTPGCKFYGDPDLGMMCSKCFQSYTINESRQMAAGGARPFPNAPLASMPAEGPHYQLSMMKERCKENCGYRCSRTTFPYCHECASRMQKQGQEKAAATAVLESALGHSAGGQPPAQFSTSPTPQVSCESSAVTGNTATGMGIAAHSNMMNAAQNNLSTPWNSNMMPPATQGSMMNTAQSNLSTTVQSAVQGTSFGAADPPQPQNPLLSQNPPLSQSPLLPQVTPQPQVPSVSDTQLLEDMTRALVTGEDPCPPSGPHSPNLMMFSVQTPPMSSAQAGPTAGEEPHPATSLGHLSPPSSSMAQVTREPEAKGEGQTVTQTQSASPSSQPLNAEQELTSAAALAKSLANAPVLEGVKEDPQTACASQGCAEPALHQTLCVKCYVSQGMTSPETTTTTTTAAMLAQQKRSLEAESLTNKKMEMMEASLHSTHSSAPPSFTPACSKPLSNATYTKAFGAFVPAESRSHPGSLRDLKDIPPMEYTQTWIQDNQFAGAPLLLSHPREKSPPQGLPEKPESETLGNDLIASGAGCFSSTQRCIGEGCGNAVPQAGKLCQQCQDILRHARHGRQGGQASGQGEVEGRNRHGNIQRPPPSPGASRSITVPPEFNYVYMPSERQGQLCTSAGCRLFGDPRQAGMCFKHYQEHLVSIAKATSTLPAARRPNNVASIPYASKIHITPNSISFFTPQQVAVPPPPVSMEMVGGAGRSQEPSLGEMYNRVTGQLAGKCLNPTCTNFGNRNKGGLCNSCAMDQKATDDLISRAIYGEEEIG